MCLTAQPLSNSPGTIYLLHPGIRFGRVVMCFVEVAGVSTRLSPYTLHSLSLSRMPLRRPCFPGVARLLPRLPLGLVHLGFYFGGVVMRFVEVAGVSTRLTAFFSTCAS